MSSYSSVEAALLLFAHLPKRYAISLETAHSRIQALGVHRSPDTVRRWLHILVDLGYAEKEHHQGHHRFKQASHLPWINKQQDALPLVFALRYLSPVLPDRTLTHYQGLIDGMEVTNELPRHPWLSCIDIDIPSPRNLTVLNIIKDALFHAKPLRLTLIGRCTLCHANQLIWNTRGLWLTDHHPQPEPYSLAHILAATPQEISS